MSLPTSVPNQVSAPIVYPKHRDNNWGHYMNDNFQHIAERADVLKIDVRDKAKNIEISVAKHFDNLRNAMNKVADEYNIAVHAGRQNVIDNIKADIDAQVASAVGKLHQVTIDQVAQIEEIKASLLVAITNIQSDFSATEAYIQAGIDKINKVLDSEIEATAAGKIDVVNKTKTVRELLLEHMGDYNNPHAFDGSQDSGAPVYQPDPNGTEAIFPMHEDDVIEIEANDENVEFNEDTDAINGDSSLDTLLFNPLLQNLLGKYLVLETNNAAEYNFYRFGHNPDLVNVSLTADRVIEFGGDVAEVATTGPLLEVKLTWLATTANHNEGAFTILAFADDTPVVGDAVIVNHYPPGGVVGTTTPTTITMNITRLNYTNKPTVIDEIISYANPGDPIELSYGYLQFDNLAPADILHWPTQNTELAQTVHRIVLINKAATHNFDTEEVEFPVPPNLQDPGYLGETKWSMVEAVAGTADHKNVAIHRFSDGLLHVFFEPDPVSGYANAYTFEFNDENDPLNVGPVVNISRYIWDTKTNNVPTAITGTGLIVV